MSDSNQLEKDLPVTSTSFQFDIVGSVTNKRFLGEFVCKIPTIRDQSLIAVHESVLNGSQPSFLEPGIRKMHRILSYLKYTITEAPKFWKDSDYGYNLRDSNVVEAVYEEVIAKEEEWLTKIWGKAEDGTQTKS